MYIGFEAFSHCNSLLDNITISGVIYIGNYAFEHCDSFYSINIPPGVTVIK